MADNPSRVFRDANRKVTPDMREATVQETLDWLNGYISDPRFIETEFGLMVKES